VTAERLRAPNQHFVDEAAREEDVRWMHQHGESAVGAARRLGISSSGFHQWCRRQGLLPLWQAMADRNPVGLGVNQYDPNRRVR
jgi:hypothetical protein